ncbi:MAG TPA: hypothetical protein VFG73_08925 [Rhodanobacteraceae bacterium]|nr:hypothetical protein [Rhodanobacteraceae bacterium]
MNGGEPTGGTCASAGGFDYVACWPHAGEGDRAAVQAFWQREAAFDGMPEPAARLDEVLLYARDAGGEIVAVCTAKPVLAPRLGQPMYYWRAFVGAAWRARLLSRSLLRRSCELLEAHARQNDFPCIGVLLELENSQFRDHARRATWRNPPFTYIGQSARGLEVRVYYFRDAMLKAQVNK